MTGLIVYYSVGVVAVFATAFFAYWISHRYRVILPRSILIALIMLSGYIFFAQYLKYKSLHMYVDFAHWLQVLQSITIKGWPEVFSQEFIFPGTLNYFSAHFVPLVYLFAIPFKLFPYPETLIVLNVAVMLSSAIPLYQLAILQGRSRYFGLCLVTFLFWYPTFQYITLYEFEMLRFSIPVLLWMLYFWERQRMRWYFFFVLLAILVREEIGLTIAMFGISIFFFERKKKVFGLSTILLGFIAFGVITQRIMPALSNAVNFQHIAAGIAPQLGYTPFAVIKNSILHPLILLNILLHPVKLVNISMLFLPLLFLPFFSATVLFSIIANVGIGLMSTSFIHSSYMLYYIAPSVPFIFYALIKAWPKMTRRLREIPLTHALLAAVLVSNIFFGPSPLSLQFWFKNIQPAPFRTQDFHWSVYRVTDHHREAEEFVRMIPDSAIIATQQFLAPRLYKKQGIMIFPELQSKDKKWQADYVLLDTTNNNLKPESPAYVRKEDMAIVRENKEWLRIAAEDGYELYKRL